MSMLFDLRRLPAAQLHSLLADPSDIFFFLHGQEPYQQPKSFFQRIFKGNSKQKTEKKWEPPTEGTVLELDKNWHVLHYLFCRSTEEGEFPAATLLCGGQEIGSVDVGYGPARALLPDEVEKFYQFLTSLNKESYWQGVTAQALEESEIYGAYQEWGKEDAFSLWEYVEQMKSLIARAVANGEGVILYVY